MLLAAAALTATIIPFGIPPAIAAGSPDISLTKAMPGETLYGTPTPVTLTASNSSATNGFNLSFNDVLPPGVTFIPGSPAPTRTLTDSGGNTVIIWENVADLQIGTTFEVSYDFLATGPSYVVGDTITNSAGAYVNSDARFVPDFDPVEGTATADYTGWATDAGSTDLVPFLLEKTEPNTETELLRGVHTNKTVYTLEVSNNLVNDTNGFQIEDYLPAGLEYLGCAAIDNSAGATVEYPGSGRIDDTAHPTLTNCIAPSTVETVTVDPDGPGPLPNGVYTHIVWTAADLAAQANILAGGTLTIDYAAAIPLRQNVEFPPATPTSGVQASNLDNNTGSLTTDEQLLENYADATGTYTGDGLSYSDDDTEEVEGRRRFHPQERRHHQHRSNRYQQLDAPGGNQRIRNQHHRHRCDRHRARRPVPGRPRHSLRRRRIQPEPGRRLRRRQRRRNLDDGLEPPRSPGPQLQLHHHLLNRRRGFLCRREPGVVQRLVVQHRGARLNVGHHHRQ